MLIEENGWIFLRLKQFEESSFLQGRDRKGQEGNRTIIFKFFGDWEVYKMSRPRNIEQQLIKKG